MKYIDKRDNVDYVYDVTIDDGLRDLFNTVVRKGSYGIDGEYKINYGRDYIKSTRDGNEFCGPTLVNGDQAFVNVSSLNYYKYEHPGDSISFNGTKRVTPQLAQIINNILINKSDGIKDLIAYSSSKELIPIDQQITDLNNSIKAMGDFDIDKKISALTELKELIGRKKHNQYFNPELLRTYYEEAKSLITFTLVKTITYSKGPDFSFSQLFDKKEEETFGAPKSK